MDNDNVVDVKYTEVNSDNKKYFTLDEVCDLLQLETSVVIYWCNKFKEKLNIKSIGNFTIFTEIDFKNLKTIKHLIIEEKMDVKKAKDYLSKHTEILIKNTELQPTEESLLNVIAKIISNQNEKINSLSNSQEQLLNLNKQLVERQDQFIKIMNQYHDEMCLDIENKNDKVEKMQKQYYDKITEQEQRYNKTIEDLKQDITNLIDKQEKEFTEKDNERIKMIREHQAELKKQYDLIQQSKNKGFFSWFKRG